ncbi:MAG: response regulator [Chloroflexi bacterium]|nr:response regulator [Chloroflexota bacterium]
MADKQSILIVEDDLDLAEMRNAYFRVQGYDVLTAAWGEDAVRISQENTPHIVLLDIRLPDIDGYEVCLQCVFKGARLWKNPPARHRRLRGVPPNPIPAPHRKPAHHLPHRAARPDRQTARPRIGSRRLHHQTVRYSRTAIAGAQRLAPGQPRIAGEPGDRFARRQIGG